MGTTAPGAGSGAGSAAALRRALASEEGSDSSAPASAGTWRSVETLRHAQVGAAQALMGESGRGERLGPRGAERSVVPPRRGPSPSLSVLPPHAAPRWSRPGAAESAPWRLGHARRHSNRVRGRRRGGGRRPRPRPRPGVGKSCHLRKGQLGCHGLKALTRIAGRVANLTCSELMSQHRPPTTGQTHSYQPARSLIVLATGSGAVGGTCVTPSSKHRKSWKQHFQKGNVLL